MEEEKLDAPWDDIAGENARTHDVKANRQVRNSIGCVAVLCSVPAKNPTTHKRMEEVRLTSASSECERLCINQQRALVACVESIRRNHSDDDTTTKATTMTATCLPEAVMAWTKCCEEANLTGHEKT